MKNQAPSISDLTPEQATALIDFAAKHGRNWKQTLLDGWLRSAYPGALQQIRNQHGPMWLADLKNLEA